MKRGSTMFLKFVIYVLGAGTLALAIFILPAIAREMVDVMPVQYELLPILVSMAGAAIPFYIALYQGLKLLNLIDKNNAFSELSVKSLIKIKHCAIAIAVLYIACAPFVFILAEADDSPGAAAIALVIIGASFVIAVFAAVLQRLLQNALDIKTENELTV